MKFSIRSKFSVGMFFLIIILVLSIFSSYYMNKLSKETGAILKENYLSLVYARDMSEGLTNINQEITNSFLTNKNSDSLLIKKELNIIDKSLQSEKNNFTEPGEDKLVNNFETGFNEYRAFVAKFLGSPQPASNVVDLQKKFGALYQQLVLLSQMNGKAIEVKTDNNKISSQDALTQMTIIAILCFIIALFYSYSFSSYSNERFFQLYNGIKEIMVTENGAAFPDHFHEGMVNDPERVGFLKDHIAQVFRARQQGVPVNGYFVWTFLDNFEWAEGFRPKFGLVHVDYETQKRTVKASGYWYRDFLGTHQPVR